MSCEGMGPLLSRYVDGEATGEDRAKVEAHVAACPDCRKELEIFGTNERLVAEALTGAFDWNGLAAQTVDAVRKAAAIDREGQDVALPEGSASAAATGPLRARLLNVKSMVGVAAAVFFLVSASLAYSVFVLHDSLDNLCPRLNQLAGTVDRLIAEQANLIHTVKTRDVASPARVGPDAGHSGQTAHPCRTMPPHESGDPTDRTPKPPDIVKAPLDAAEGEDPIRAFEVSALPDRVYAYWTFNAKSISPDAKYYLYRRQEDETDYDEIAEGSAGSCDSYIDHNVKPMTPYEYRLEVDTGKGVTGVRGPVLIKTSPDLEVIFQGSAAQGEGQALMGRFKVIRRVEGRWVSALFTVTEGELVGGVKYAPEIRREVDFSTDYVLAEVKHAERQKSLGHEKKKTDENGVAKDVYKEIFHTETIPKATLDDFAGDVFSLWSGEAVRGTRGLLMESRTQ